MSEERGGGAAQRALEHFEGELMFEGDWVPPTPFNGIAFLAAGAVLRHLHKRTQARGEPHARARPKRKKTRSRAPTAPPSLTPPTSPPTHPTTTEPRTPLSPVSIARPRQRTESRARTGAGGAGTDTKAPPRGPPPNIADDGARDDLRDPTAVEAASASASGGTDGGFGGGGGARRRTDPEDPVTRLAAESREAHLRRVAAALAARDGQNPSDVHPLEAPPSVGEILPEAPPETDQILPQPPGTVPGTVSPATSTLLAAESLPETARSQIAFFRRLSQDGGRRTERDGESAGDEVAAEEVAAEEVAAEEGRGGADEYPRRSRPPGAEDAGSASGARRRARRATAHSLRRVDAPGPNGGSTPGASASGSGSA